ncbi:Protein TEX261 [Trichoplax sp. H2]|nr:Protein TEX261 [Trichoplax sp. H2]|eukprot:RDD37396.1 Protein TEX261 [Trichoplax sp. H2]
MAWFLYSLSWLALALQGIFVILSLASGLYYLCELVEEYSTTASKVFRYLIWITTVIFVCLWLFDSFPLLVCAMGILANLVHLMVLKDYPAIAMTSFPFIMTVVMAIINHFLAFRYFATVWYPFSEASFAI